MYKVAQFFGRIAQLKLMESLWESPQASFLVLYGRRRIGKTSLLIHWINQTGYKALYSVAEPTTPAKQRHSFSQALYAFANPSASLPSDDFSYGHTKDFFPKYGPDERVVV
ncbi:hypothetical protein KQH40_01225 [bacterium]|nr:hypothetical protein [bacterium]